MASNNSENIMERSSKTNIFEKMLVNPLFNSETSQYGAVNYSDMNSQATSIGFNNPLNSTILEHFNADLDCDSVEPIGTTSNEVQVHTSRPVPEQIEIVNLSTPSHGSVHHPQHFASPTPITGYIGQTRSIGPGSISREPPPENAPPRPTPPPPVKRGRGRGRPSSSTSNIMEVHISSDDSAAVPNQLLTLRKMFPLVGRLVIDRTHTSTLFNMEKTMELLKIKQQAEEDKRNSVRIVPNPKQEKKEKQNRALSSLAVPKDRRVYPYYRRLLTVNGQVVTAPPKLPLGEDERVVRQFMEVKCKSYVSNEVTGSLIEEGNCSTRSYTSSVDLPEGYTLALAREAQHHELGSETNAIQVEQEVELGDDRIIHVNELPEDVSGADAAGGSSGGNKFFRTKRLCDTELKKRDYVSRELHHGWLTSRVTGLGGYGPGLTGDAIVGTAAGAALAVGANQGPIITSYTGSVGRSKRGRGAGRGSSAKAGTKRRRARSPSVSDEEGQFDDGHGLVGTGNTVENMSLSQSDRASILSFFNNAPVEELALMPGCSTKRAEVILTLRPFKNCSDLVDRLDSTKPLSSSLIQGCKEILHMRSLLVKLLIKCEKLGERMANRAGTLLEQVELLEAEQNDPDAIHTQPLLLNPRLQLKPYQLVGLNWLRLLHIEQVNGILADDMGLGKTIQAISFLAYLMEIGQRGPHLIIVPSSTLDNWRRELAYWCPQLKVLVYYGNQEERKAVRVRIYEGVDADFNVMLTTYAVGTNSIEDRAMMKRINFAYGIFDEAHMLKNMTTQRYKNLMNFKVERRLMLTGTPLQNNLVELISLLSFVMPDIFSKSTDLLKRMFQIYSKTNTEPGDDAPRSRSEFEFARITQAKNLLKPFCLRRLKQNVMQQLPVKTDEVVRLPMPDSQRSVYWDLVDQISTRFGSNGDADVSTNGDNGVSRDDTKNNTSPINLVLQLRKAANHPLLLRRLYTDDMLRTMARALMTDPDHKNANPEFIYEDMEVLNDFELHRTCIFYKNVLEKYTLPNDVICASAKMAYLDKELPQIIAKGDRVLIFSQFVIMLNILEEYLNLSSYRYLRLDGSTPVSDRQALVDQFNSDTEIPVFLLSTRAGGLGINLTGANVVILHDIDFNPYNDRQAEDRVHRIGQEKSVRVIRLLAESTVEEGIFRIASEKLKLEEDVTGVTRKRGQQTGEEDDEEDEEVVTKPAVAEESHKTLKTLKGQIVAPVDDISTDTTTVDPTSVKLILNEALKVEH